MSSNLRGDRVISSIPRDLIVEKNTNDNNANTNNKNNNVCYDQTIDQECPISKQNLARGTDPRGSININIDTGNESSADNWLYPSPKMFWNAMKRKGTLPDHLNDPNDLKTQEEMEWIVKIHNVVNEQCWQEIRKWEKFRAKGCNQENENENISIITNRKLMDQDIKLQRFLGRPDELSPRAWFKSTILGYRRPFDRHDWYVRSGPTDPPRRYIIDFYTGNQKNYQAEGNSSVYLDVRPALDSMDEAILRIRKYLCDKMNWFDGIIVKIKN